MTYFTKLRLIGLNVRFVADPGSGKNNLTGLFYAEFISEPPSVAGVLVQPVLVSSHRHYLTLIHL